MTSKEKLDLIVKLLEDKKAVDLEVIELSDKSLMCDYFVICTGTSNIHIRTLCDTITLDGRKMGLKKSAVEGRNNAKWILVDFGDVVVHVFDREEREYYNLEDLWKNLKPLEQ
ncbi:MAG: ribosome silencing factor [Armatimonadetes bacterium]|nr:ribosome silencing factor [Candidatus Hippobium faecium]